jgi:hypothetical protein
MERGWHGVWALAAEAFARKSQVIFVHNTRQHFIRTDSLKSGKGICNECYENKPTDAEHTGTEI